ncbi:DUF2004 domain-containing protein [Microbacterium gorillae]|uniref:DUF2004 domain-containing protein n=1 Tax=Microbacterium gorillae TaxID=1231063 RepID=UPI001144D886|nr:DUF2004 domain-containing protein [Microbacterium gorillae]
MLASRHLGPLVFCTQDSDAVCDGAMPTPTGSCSVTLAVADPSGFTAEIVAEMDAALDRLPDFDVRARDAFARDIDVDGTPVAQLWAFYRDEVEDFTGDRDAFLAALHLVHLGVFPDGAWDTSEPLSLDYAIPEPITDQLLVARFRRGAEPRISWES